MKTRQTSINDTFLSYPANGVRCASSSRSAFSTYERLIASPPGCRLPPPSPIPPARPPRAPAEARPPWHFDFFPLCLPPHAYRPPPLSEVLAAASRSEAPMFLTEGARPNKQGRILKFEES